MMNILIADDELIFREYLRRVIDWERYGFRIAGEAKHGLEALELAAAQPPDIALVDITMPFMDGLELAERLKREYPATSVVLVTGHNEFDYARRALKLGVEDYILKPFSKEELLLTLLKLQQHHHKALEEKATLQSSVQLMKEGLLNRLVSERQTEKAATTIRQLEAYDLRLDRPAYTVACIEIDDMDRKWSEVSERLLWKYAVSNILAEAMEDDGKPMIFNGPEGRIVCLIGHAASAGGASGAPGLEAYERLCALIKRYLKFTITVGVGNGYEGTAHIADSYKEALAALQNKFVLGCDRVIRYDASAKGASSLSQYPLENKEALLHDLRMADDSRLAERLGELFRSVREQKLSIDYTYVVCMGLVSVCLSYISEAGHPIEDCFGEHFFPYSEIQRLGTVQQAETWITNLFMQASAYARQHKKTRASIIARSAKAYVEQHYADPELGVDRVAGHAFINASYLRAVFKKELGMTLSDYITHVRMHKARDMLGEGNVKLAHVAEATGYSDLSYFSKSFKKFFGRPPSEYENVLRERG
ncbi:response regulator [Cohnella ginsengisoli]|uniref:Response regulator n=1 Tax=Cohnella ginsengisoli TaxID=425004 RepID=A0A9X4KFA2_9BACL|nr:response regulator [Cohnella ginsengisoli]MDG0791048.1 response regulator [Cohnella ginsengisoli]